MTKVCFISLDAWPLFSRCKTKVQGGSEVDVYFLSTELAKNKDFEVSLITGNYGQKKIEQIENVTIYRVSDGFTPEVLATSLWGAMNRANADIYFKKSASAVAALVALYCKLHGRKFFLRTSHDIDCDGTYIREGGLRGRLFKWALKRANRVFVQKENNRISLKETVGISATVISNGHRISELSNQKRDCILWVGRNAGFKRPELFLKLAKETPDERFVMICQRYDNKYDDLLAEIRPIENLTFIRGVSFHEIDNYFRRAKMFVNTSTAEGFPNTFIQACISGTPILSLKVNPDEMLTWLTNFHDKNVCGMCAMDDWQRFGEMLAELLKPEFAEEYGCNARRCAEENHDIKKIIGTYEKLFLKENNLELEFKEHTIYVA